MSRVTTAQRGMIVSLLSKAEYDPRTVTLMHRRLGVADSFLYRPVDEWLDSLTVESASALIDKLQREAA